MKKLPNQLSTEELLKQVDEIKLSETDNIIIEDNIVEFLSYYNIRAGNNPVNRKPIYKMYKAWNKSNSNVSSKQFGHKLGEYFKADHNYIYINIEAIDLTKKAKDVFFKSENSNKFKNKNYKEQIERFINNFNIKDGKYIVQTSVLYYIYEEWCLNNRLKILTDRDFSSYIRFYFKHYKEHETSKIYVYIDKLQLKVDGVTLEKAKTWAENRAKVEKEVIKEETNS